MDVDIFTVVWLCFGVAVLAIIADTELSSAKLWREHDKAAGLCDSCSMQGRCRLEERHRNFLNYIQTLRNIRTGHY